MVVLFRILFRIGVEIQIVTFDKHQHPVIMTWKLKVDAVKRTNWID